jgi:hypothetical protein
MYHETFWIAVSAAAPVIALAAIVAFSNDIANTSRMRQWFVEHPPWTRPQEKRAQARKTTKTSTNLAVTVGLMCVLNTILQAVVLAFSLSGVASHVDEMPIAVAIAAEVAGIAALAAGAIIAAFGRRESDRAMALSIQVPDDRKEPYPRPSEVRD